MTHFCAIWQSMESNKTAPSGPHVKTSVLSNQASQSSDASRPQNFNATADPGTTMMMPSNNHAKEAHDDPPRTAPQHNELNSMHEQQQLSDAELKNDHQQVAGAEMHDGISSAETSNFHVSKSNLHVSTAEASNIHATRTNISAPSPKLGSGLQSPLARSTPQLDHPGFQSSVKLNPDRFSASSSRMYESERPATQALSQTQASMLQWFPALKSVLKASCFASHDSLQLDANVRFFFFHGAVFFCETVMPRVLAYQKTHACLFFYC